MCVMATTKRKAADLGGAARHLARVPARALDDAAADQRATSRRRACPPSPGTTCSRRCGMRPRAGCARSSWPSGCCSRTAGSAGCSTGSRRRAGRAGLCQGDRRASTSSSTDEGAEMLERMWPVYARGIAEDFLPALGSNPCEVRADARDDRAPVRRGPGGRGRGGLTRRPASPAGRRRSRRTSRVAEGGPWPKQDELRLELAEALGRAAVLGRVGGEVVLGRCAGRGWR